MIDFNGAPAIYRVTGTGRPVVLLHAGASTNAQWHDVEQYLLTPVKRIVPDLLGFGGTGAWSGVEPLSHDHNAELVATVLNAEVSGAVDVVGHSYGGAVALRLAALHPERMRSLVVIEPIVTSLLREANDPLAEESNRFAHEFIALVDVGNVEAAWRHFFDGRGTPGRWAAMSERSKMRFQALTPQTVAGFRANIDVRQTLEDCRRIPVPTTIVRGANTAPWDVQIADILRTQLPAAPFHVVRGAGHMSPLTHPAAIAEIIDQHLAHVKQDDPQHG
jgi:pimeloyl-ACP methyl ester carboxylesterase